MVMILAIVVVIVMTMLVAMIGAMAMICRRETIRSALRLERRLDRPWLEAEAAKHRLHRGVARHPQTLRHDLHRDVTVAQPPRETRKATDVGHADFEQRFRLGDDLDQPAVVEQQRVADLKGAASAISICAPLVAVTTAWPALR